MIEIDNQPWFVATDVLRSLGMDTDQASNYLRPLSGDEQRLITLIQGRGNPNKRIISESDLYKLVMRSDKPEARAFQDWVTKVVLPAIRVSSEGTPCEPPRREPLECSSLLLIYREPPTKI